MPKFRILRLSFLIAACSAFVVSQTLASCVKKVRDFDNASKPAKLAVNLVIDSIAIHKSDHQMLVFRRGRLLKTYAVHLGLNPIGPKRRQGDFKTPEGLYFINCKNANSQFHKSLGVSYPNAIDKQRSAKIGLSPGGDIMIHGLPNGEENVGPDRYQNDWTWGCIAITNAEIEELFEHVEVRTPLLITP